MASNKKKSKLIIIISFIVVVLVFLVIALVKFSSSSEKEENFGKAEVTSNYVEESNKNKNLEKLYSMTEQERITFYCGEFFKLVDNKKYEEAYELLYDKYKENYFPTLASFREYIKTYFPDDFSLNYTNFERLGDIYVLWIDLKDTLNGSKYGHNFSLNVVIKENNFNDFDLSFSRNSAVE